MNVLGINVYYGDVSAALPRDGRSLPRLRKSRVEHSLATKGSIRSLR